jgi:hypothetical protein
VVTAVESLQMEASPPKAQRPVVPQHPAGSGTATLSWYAPTANSDGSALTDLAGYRIYYGNNSNSLTQAININTVGITTYVITNLGVGTWHFAIKAYNSGGVESNLSNIASKTIS